MANPEHLAKLKERVEAPTSDLTSRLAADSTGWEQDPAKFDAAFERVVEALRAEKGRK